MMDPRIKSEDDSKKRDEDDGREKVIEKREHEYDGLPIFEGAIKMQKGDRFNARSLKNGFSDFSSYHI